MFFLSLLKKKKEICRMKLFLCSSGISLGRYCQKNLYQKQGVQKKDKKEGWSYGGGWGASIEGESNLLHTMH